MNGVEQIEIETIRFRLRQLSEKDVTARYLSWLKDPTSKKFITTATTTRNLANLKEYVRDRIGRKDVLFLGIFEKETGLHIGNIKYEPVDSDRKYAIVGVMIGEPSFRGKGVTAEVLQASARWLKVQRKIKQIVLGVHEENIAAIRAYKKAGFIVAETPYIPSTPDSLTMVWRF